jgi:membrane protein implicated in regulation of membrane protease activity
MNTGLVITCVVMVVISFALGLVGWYYRRRQENVQAEQEKKLNGAMDSLNGRVIAFRKTP